MTRPAFAKFFLLAGGLVIGGYTNPAYSQFTPMVPDPHTPGLTLLPSNYGAYSGHFLRGGRGLTKPLPPKDALFEADAAWTLTAWVEVAPGGAGDVTIAGVGERTDEDARLFRLADGHPALWLGAGHILRCEAPLAGGWHLLTATFADGTVRLFVDAAQVGQGELHAGAVRPEMVLAPVEQDCGQPLCPHFGGRIGLLTLRRGAASVEAIAAAARAQPDFRLVAFEEGSKPWPLQSVQWIGNSAPQEPSTLPQPKAPLSKPLSAPLPPERTALTPAGGGDWILRGGWKLAAQPDVHADAAAIATPGFDDRNWLAATVPGTVLTTMIARGVYPDPDFGLDNLAIPELLNKQDYWYRAEFSTPAASARHTLRLVLDGINYHAEIWLNGERLGEMTGAFARGVIDVSGKLRATGQNALAIRVSPAPHPGIPNEQSIVFGAGFNGGAMEIDGPTFMATEGWDWFPPMRDRDTGLWQDVHLVATGTVEIGDPQVVTRLPLPDISQADVSVDLPLENTSAAPVSGVVTASFEGVTVRKSVTVPVGESTIHLTAAEFPQLHLAEPRLWWPNGYGRPELYHLRVEFAANGVVSDTKTLTFGVREVSYELSLLDDAGDLRRVDYDPTLDRGAPRSAVDVTHAAMRQVPGGWAASIAKDDGNLNAMRTVTDTRATPDLILRVNGVRIAVRGGSWGMEDTRKRISRAHLEPFFRLDRDANVNIIRNWQGQNTEPVFYELADEYGLMVWNDFWEVTTDSNLEADDPQLFLRNAKDTILRYRNHPSIVMWCGRNEGVPQPAINEGLIALTHALDGTRYYSPSSNQVNLEPSGPYSYEDPAEYYTRLDRGFAVEVGTPSLPTLEWFHRWLPAEDQWPIDDDWAYHNWHPYDDWNAHMQAQFGAAHNLEDYERKAQMMNYVNYRAIFEGFNQHLWAPNGGRLLWMTQPAWPSMLWGILSSDYDTQASYYATRKACEPLHVQMDLSNDDVAVVNTKRESVAGATVSATVYSLDGKELMQREKTVDVPADDVTAGMHLDLAPYFAPSGGAGTVLVRLQLRSAGGDVLSENTYWRAANDAGYRALNTMAPAAVAVEARLLTATPLPGRAEERTVEVRLHNQASVPAIEAKVILERADGSQVLPAYYSDNYISLLPGEEKTITIKFPSEELSGKLRLRLRGWNVMKSASDVSSN